MLISELTQSKIDYLEIMCNFTEAEHTLFMLRSKGISLDECSERMNRSLDSVKQLSRKVNNKIKEEL